MRTQAITCLNGCPLDKPIHADCRNLSGAGAWRTTRLMLLWLTLRLQPHQLYHGQQLLLGVQGMVFDLAWHEPKPSCVLEASILLLKLAWLMQSWQQFTCGTSFSACSLLPLNLSINLPQGMFKKNTPHAFGQIAQKFQKLYLTTGVGQPTEALFHLNMMSDSQPLQTKQS